MPSRWLVPAAFAAHAAEEAPGFTSWARRNASKRCTQRDFVRNNALGAILTVAYREYSPGLLIALAMFVPLWVGVTHGAVRDVLMTRRGAAAGTAAASLFHALIVAEQVYRVDWRSLRR